VVQTLIPQIERWAARVGVHTTDPQFKYLRDRALDLGTVRGTWILSQYVMDTRMCIGATSR
jgi:hypothetical protein